MILAGGDPEAEVGADMLPQDVAHGPKHAAWRRRRAFDGLPLRGKHAKRLNANTCAQISRFGGNISRTAELSGWNARRSASSKALNGLSAAVAAFRSSALAFMLRIAYVNGRYQS